MAIDINNVNASKQVSQDLAQRLNREARAEKQQSAESSDDRVELQLNSKRTSELREKINASEAFDAGRVREIADAIANGKYPVNSERIALKFLELEEQLY